MNFVRSVSLLMFVLSFVLTQTVFAVQNLYQITKSVSLKGNTDWDDLTLDPAAKRLYITRSTHVSVLNTDSFEEEGQITGTAGVHGVALAPALNKGFTSNSDSNSVTVFDLKTLKTVTTIPTGKSPDAIVYEPTSNRLVVFNAAGKSATIAEAETGKVLKTISLNGTPELAVAAPSGKVFVNLADKNSVAVIDAKKNKHVATWPLPRCEGPTGIALDSTTNRIFASCQNGRLIVVDSISGKTVSSVPIGKEVDATAFDPTTKLIFNANGDGTVTIVKQGTGDSYAVAQVLKTKKTARTLALDPTTHRIYTVAASFKGKLPKSGAAYVQSKSMVPDSAMLLVYEKNKSEEIP